MEEPFYCKPSVQLLNGIRRASKISQEGEMKPLQQALAGS
jgi:hypothetical protein